MKDLITLIDAKKNDMWKMKASFLPKNINADAYFQRALFEVMNNDKISDVANNPKGAESIFRCISRALQMGLQIGGQFPQASLMPSFDSKNNCKVAILVISAIGYKYLALSDPAVLKDIEHIAVYEKEIESIIKGDQLTGEFEYKKIFAGDRGKIAGAWFVITKLDGTKCGKWVHAEEVKKRMEASPSYKAVQDKKISASMCPWLTWSEEMFINKAYQIVLSPYAKVKEGASLRLAVENEEPIEPTEQNIESRASKHLSGIIEAETVVTEQPEKKEEAKPEKQNKTSKNNSDSDLF